MLLAGIFSSEPMFDVANEETSISNEASGYVVSTEYAANAESKDNWVQLSPFGKFPHPMGVQVFSKEDSENCVNEFDSTWNKALGNGTKLGFGGLPWYVGHPDNDSFRAQYPDKSSKGRIKQLETRHAANCKSCNEFCNQTSDEPCREHGLFGNVKWNEEGKRLIGNEAYHGHSVNWRVKRVGNELRPVFLKSVGFTNEPNIPVSQITAANEKNMKNFLDYVNGLLKPAKPYATNDEAEAAMTDYANEHQNLKKDLDAARADGASKAEAISALHKKFASNETFTPIADKLTKAGFEIPNENIVDFLALQIVEADTMIGNSEEAIAALTKAGVKVPETGVIVFLANELTTANGKVTKSETDLTAANTRATTAEGSLKTKSEEFANERKNSDTRLCTALLSGGFVNKVEHDALVTELGNESTRITALDRASKLKPKMSVYSAVGILGNVDASVKEQTGLQERLQTIANELRGKNPKKTFVEVWEMACNSKEGKEIVAQMKQPDTSKVTSHKKRQTA